MKRKQAGVRLRPEQDAAIEKILATDPELTRSRLIRMAIDEYLARHYPLDDRDTATQRRARVTGLSRVPNRE